MESGQKVNLNKSRVIFSNNSTSWFKDQCTQSLEIEEKLPLENTWASQSSTNSDFQFLLDNMRQKLVGWKSSTLSMASRKVLAKVSRKSIPSHVMSYIKISKGITDQQIKSLRTLSGALLRRRKKYTYSVGIQLPRINNKVVWASNKLHIGTK